MKNLSRLQLICSVMFLVFWGNNCISSLQNSASNLRTTENKNLILEVMSETSKTVYPSGKILEARLYDNKEVEFDFYLPNTPDRVGMPFTSEKKSAKLSQEDFDKIKFLLGKSDLLNAKNSYAPIERILDATIKKTVSFKFGTQGKIIVLEENDSHLHLEEKSNLYPASLIRLLELVEDINKRLRKQIDPESR